MREEDTRHIPWTGVEAAYARNRDPAERTPIAAGMRVYYRRDAWDPDPVGALVLDVQELDERNDPNLWHAVRDVTGQQIFTPDGPLFAPVADPWPWVLLQPDDTPWRTARTWEARLRGAPGWLPLGWRTRPVRTPDQVVLRPLPPLNTNPANITKGG